MLLACMMSAHVLPRLPRVTRTAEQTVGARSGFTQRFEREADPDGMLSEEERHERRVARRRDYMRKLAAKSARARREPALRLRVGDAGHSLSRA
jgi:hypothetical protein